ncbi:g1555 [Coccomyxa elongata]
MILVGGPLAISLGRRGVMVSGGVAFFLGALMLASAWHWAQLVEGRIFVGIGIGFINASVPTYISEVAPPNLRGGLNMLFQLMTAIGIFAASVINWGVAHYSWGWRFSLGNVCFLALNFIINAALCPDSPNSILEHDPANVQRARKTLQELRPDNYDVDQELEEIRTNAIKTRMQSFSGSLNLLFSRPHRKQAMAAMLIPYFQQFSGISFLMFYAPQLFNITGNSVDTALAITCLFTGVNVLGTIIGILCVDE